MKISNLLMPNFQFFDSAYINNAEKVRLTHFRGDYTTAGQFASPPCRTVERK